VLSQLAVETKSYQEAGKNKLGLPSTFLPALTFRLHYQLWPSGSFPNAGPAQHNLTLRLLFHRQKRKVRELQMGWKTSPVSCEESSARPFGSTG